MDFGSILDKWDDIRKREPAATTRSSGLCCSPLSPGQEAPGAGERVSPQLAWMRLHDVVDKDALEEADETPAERRRRLRHARPDASLDLHGLTREEAHQQLEDFFAQAKREGWEKVQIVHGKGNHSEGEAVLKRDVQRFIEACPFAGERGSPDARSGGAGATWVLLKVSI